jgi:hypothetical protein
VLAEGGVGVGDADELDLGVFGEISEEALDVAVDEAHDGDADGGWGLSGGSLRGEDKGCEERGGEDEFRRDGRDHMDTGAGLRIQATEARPFFFTSVRSLRDAPCGFFSPRSHWEMRLTETPRCRAKTAWLAISRSRMAAIWRGVSGFTGVKHISSNSLMVFLVIRPMEWKSSAVSCTAAAILLLYCLFAIVHLDEFAFYHRTV